MASAWLEPRSDIPAEWPAERTAEAINKRYETGVRSITIGRQPHSCYADYPKREAKRLLAKSMKCWRLKAHPRISITSGMPNAMALSAKAQRYWLESGARAFMAQHHQLLLSA